jgi:hypothetical protein
MEAGMRTMIVPAARRAATMLAVALSSVLPVSGARAQSGYDYELRLEGGGWLPTAAISHDLKSASLLGVGGRYMLAYGFALTGSAWWASSADKSATSPSEGVNVTQGDVGLEWGRRVTSLGPYAGVLLIGGGVGGRSYAPKNPSEPDRSSLEAFGAVGLAFDLNHLVWRIEARDNLSTWNGLRDNQSLQGNDVELRAGIGWRW